MTFAMLMWVSSAQAGVFGFAKDRDGDGIRDREDACPALPEAYNGYMDQDGCPDDFTALEVEVAYNRQRLPNAPLVVQLGNQTIETRGHFMQRDLLPGTPVSLLSSAECLGATSSFVLTPEPMRVRLALVADLRPVKLVVRGPDGSPGKIRIQWPRGNEACAPSGPMVIEGESTVTLGVGTHIVGVGRGGARPLTIVVDEDTTELILESRKYGENRGDESRGDLMEPTVYFASDASRISDAAEPALDEVAAWLSANPEGSIRIEGHADERATNDYNLRLSEQRAVTVRDALVARGVDPDRLRVLPLGERVPAEEGWTQFALAQNRRVHFRQLP